MNVPIALLIVVAVLSAGFGTLSYLQASIDNYPAKTARFLLMVAVACFITAWIFSPGGIGIRDIPMAFFVLLSVTFF